MPNIHLVTTINAPILRVFDLYRSIEMHEIAGAATDEKAIKGVTSGLINLNETVTFKAKHFSVSHILKAKITEYEAPNLFVDEMVASPFTNWKHQHNFKEVDGTTLVTDILQVGGLSGMMAFILTNDILEKYLEQLLKTKNTIVKEYAETDKWKTVLNKKE